MTKLKGRVARETNTTIQDRGHKRALMLDVVAGNDGSSDAIELRPKATDFKLRITVADLWSILETRFAKGKI